MSAVMALACSAGVVAVIEDLRCRRIPNWLTATGVSGGLVCGAWHGWHSVGLAAAGAVLGFLILLPFHWCGAMGGGDVKLMAAYGALLGPSGILLAAVFAAVFGGMGAAGALVWNRQSRAIPYAPAIVLGAWVSLLGGGV